MEGRFDPREAPADLEMLDTMLCDGWGLRSIDENEPGPTSGTKLAPPFPFPQPAACNLYSALTPSRCFKIFHELYPSNLKMTEETTRNEGMEIGTTRSFAQGDEIRRRWWIEPRRNSYTLPLHKKLAQVIDSLRQQMNERDFLIQVWLPEIRRGKQVLTTAAQPYSFNTMYSNLESYREVSRSYNFAAEADSEEFIGLPGRVFLGKLPEWTPDVRFFTSHEYPRINYAQQYDVHGSLALPIFGQGGRTCLGVVEMITISQKIDCRPDIECICRALEAVDLTSARDSIPPTVKVQDKPFQLQAALPEIKQVLESLCRSHRLPIALTWAPSAKEGTHGIPHFDDISSRCFSTVDSAHFVTEDGDDQRFLDACSDHHLRLGEGIVGKVVAKNKPCLAIDVTTLSKTDYPLCHHARLFGLRAALGVPLRNIYTGSIELVLELFFPKDCLEPADQRRTLNSLMNMMQQCFRSFVFFSGREREIELIIPVADVSNQETLSSTSKEDSVMTNSRKGKGPSPLFENHKQISLQGLRTTEHGNQQMHLGMELFKQNYGTRNADDASDGSTLVVERETAGKRKPKAEKTISLQVLQQYFAGSLKDAAKSIGVCPTTLKRICRQHGITRWPSRKIKKVGNSLQKLQLVIDSVQGAEGSLQLSSFYSSFPQLSEHPTPLPNGSLFSQGSLASKSLTSSFSLSSGSSAGIEANPDGMYHQAFVERRDDVPAKPQDKEALAQPQLLETFPVGRSINVKATYGEMKFRFVLGEKCGLAQLKEEIGRRIKVEDNNRLELKYLDDDWEWVLLTCNADVEECIEICRSLGCNTVQISIHVNDSHVSTGIKRAYQSIN